MNENGYVTNMVLCLGVLEGMCYSYCLVLGWIMGYLYAKESMGSRYHCPQIYLLLLLFSVLKSDPHRERADDI